MLVKLKHAAATYLTRWDIRVTLLAAVVGFFAMELARSTLVGDEERRVLISMLTVTAAVLLGLQTGIILKCQFTDARARLVPAYAGPHLRAMWAHYLLV